MSEKKKEIAKEIFSPVIKKFQRIQIQTHYKDECWSIDLIDRSSLPKYARFSVTVCNQGGCVTVINCAPYNKLTGVYRLTGMCIVIWEMLLNIEINGDCNMKQKLPSLAGPILKQAKYLVVSVGTGPIPVTFKPDLTWAG